MARFALQYDKGALRIVTGNKYFFGSASYDTTTIDWALANGWKIMVSIVKSTAASDVAYAYIDALEMIMAKKRVYL